MKNKYRIVRDSWAGYEVQYRLWWFPFMWIQCPSSPGKLANTFANIEEAKKLIERHKSGYCDHVVYEEGKDR